MITREVKKEDLPVISKLTGVNLRVLESSLNHASTTILVEDEGVKGFIMVRRLANINELTHWHLEPEHSLILKSIIRRVGEPLAALEKEGCEERIKVLEANGFKKIGTNKGIFPNNKALIFRKD